MFGSGGRFLLQTIIKVRHAKDAGNATANGIANKSKDSVAHGMHAYTSTYMAAYIYAHLHIPTHVSTHTQVQVETRLMAHKETQSSVRLVGISSSDLS